MKLIGIYISSKTTEYHLKCLKPGWYPFISSTVNERELIECPKVAEIPTGFFKFNLKEDIDVNISAIVGKNGMGKSSLIQLVLAVLNNFTFTLISNEERCYTYNISLTHGIHADLFFELDSKKFCINVDDTIVNLFQYLPDNKRISIDLNHISTDKVREILSKYFFYTITVNYVLHSFNSDSERTFSEKSKNKQIDVWYDRYFYRVDGYLTPLTIMPNRKRGVIDINEENDLTRRRLTALSFWLKLRNKKQLLENYQPMRLRWRFNDIDINSTIDRLSHLIDTSNGHNEDDLQNLYYKLLHAWEQKFNVFPGKLTDNMIQSAYNYLIYKTVKICVNYPEFGKYIFTRQGLSHENIEALVDKLISDDSHVSKKIQSTLSFLSLSSYDKSVGHIAVSDLLKQITGKSYGDVIRHLPPPFFSYELEYSKDGNHDLITIDSFSSGEKQMLYSLSGVMGQISNLSSIPAEDKQRVAYHHINIVLDEAELYFHPEYQSRFIGKFLSLINSGIIDRRRIRSVNLLIATHSPYLLSDIPSNNVLFITDESEYNPPVTFAANIYDLLKNSFFMKTGIGEFASSKIRYFLSVYHEADKEKRKSEFLENRELLNYIVSAIGDSYLHDSLKRMFNAMDTEYSGITDIQLKISQLEDELSRLKQQKDEKNSLSQEYQAVQE